MSTAFAKRIASMLVIAALSASAASAEVFLKVQDTPGEAAQRGFEQQILLSGASMSVATTPNFGPDGETLRERTPATGPVYLNKTPDRSSPRLMQAALDGRNVGTIEITFTSARPGSPQTPQYKWILEGARINSFSVNPGNPGEPPVEMLEISYESMRYQYFSVDSRTGRTSSTEEVTWRAAEGQYLEEGCG
jgi:type VI secretion system Hcp family effector